MIVGGLRWLFLPPLPLVCFLVLCELPPFVCSLLPAVLGFGLGMVGDVRCGGCNCVLFGYLLSFDHASTGPGFYWSFLLVRLWAVVQLGGAALFCGILGSSGLRSFLRNRGFGASVGFCGGLLYAAGLCYLCG